MDRRNLKLTVDHQGLAEPKEVRLAHRYTKQEVESLIKSRPFWYHKINISGVVTPGHNFDALWSMIRDLRNGVDYKCKNVLDLASYDGMWAFEAESFGAERVVATDVLGTDVFENFMLCRSLLNSSVFPYFNVSPYNLYERLDVLMLNDGKEEGKRRRFDIVQNFGLMYHLRDPLLSLSQCRSVIENNGIMLLETAVYLESDQSMMVFNNNGATSDNIYPDVTTWWAPTIPCLKEMLKASLFSVEEASIRILPQARGIGRIALIARAQAPEKANPALARELAKSYRNPGIHL